MLRARAKMLEYENHTYKQTLANISKEVAQALAVVRCIINWSHDIGYLTQIALRFVYKSHSPIFEITLFLNIFDLRLGFKGIMQRTTANA